MSNTIFSINFRIKKRIIVNKNVTPLTARPDQCEITIENCCNMNICETVSILILTIDQLVESVRKNVGTTVSNLFPHIIFFMLLKAFYHSHIGLNNKT